MFNLLTLIYVACAVILTLSTFSQLILMLIYLRYRRRQFPLPQVENLPTVAVQLPLYNERHVVRQLLNAVAALEYPHDRLTIQVLDDSTDDTVDIVARHVARLRRQGLNVTHVRRQQRTGYKAGALAYGLDLLDAEFIAIFDADFVPPSDFLMRTIPYFVDDPNLGILQTRWGHLNADANLLTRAQALSIDSHFIIEQAARNRAGLLMTFNGSGGVWRTRCIYDAGGWRDITLTEDLDLSYRAQIAGWHCLFLPDIVVPAEVPPQLEAYKRQQARWAQGTTQCLLRLFGAVWSADLTLAQRVMGTLHLAQYTSHPLMLVLLLLAPPLMLTGTLQDLPLAFLGIASLIPPFMFATAQAALYKDWWRKMLAFPIVMLLGTGLVWNNTAANWRAVKSIMTGKGGEFRRTPKFAQSWQGSRYALRSSSTLWVEGLLALYAFIGALIAVRANPALVPYLALYAIAFCTMVGWQLSDVFRVQKLAQAPIIEVDEDETLPVVELEYETLALAETQPL